MRRMLMKKPVRRPKWTLLAIALGTALGAAACSQSRRLTRFTAADIVSRNEEFATPAKAEVPIGSLWWSESALFNLYMAYPIKALEKGGILTFGTSGKTKYYYNEYIVGLTERGNRMAKSWVVTKSQMPGGIADKRLYARGVVYSFIVARRKMRRITGIAFNSGGDEAEVDFEWMWDAMPEGEYVVTDSTMSMATKNGSAKFRLYDDGWRITEINLPYDLPPGVRQ